MQILDANLAASAHLEQLDLTGCELRGVMGGPLPPRLHELRLASNHIEHIDDAALERLTRVQRLVLDGNLLEVRQFA